MGFGIGIGIGWGTRSSTPSIPGYFNLLSTCSGKIFKANAVFSQQLLSTDYSEDDYVYSASQNDRVLLGAFVEVLPEGYDTIQIEGPAYNSCEV